MDKKTRVEQLKNKLIEAVETKESFSAYDNEEGDFDLEYMMDEVYSAFEQMYPQLAQSADDRIIQQVIANIVANYGDGADPSALAQDVARAIRSSRYESVENSEDVVQIEYWQQDTMESGRWVKTKPMPRDKAEKIVNMFDRGEIVDVKQGVSEGSMKSIVGYRVVGTDVFIPIKDFEQDGRYYELRGYEFEPVWDDKQGVSEGSENLSYIGNCTDDDVIEHLFGDATGFAQAVDEYGDEFTINDLVVKYDPESDVHSFYYKKSVSEGWREMFGMISDKEKSRIQRIASKISDIPGNWDFRSNTWSEQGVAELKTALNNNSKYIKYALRLTAADYDGMYENYQGVSEGSETAADLTPRKTNALWAQINDYESRAKAAKSDIKKQHFLKMAQELRRQLPVSESGPFSYGMKKPRKGSVADLAAKKQKEQQRGKQPIEPKDQMVGNAKVSKSINESIRVVDQDYDLDQIILTLDIEGKRVMFTYTDYDEDFKNAERRDVFDQLMRKDWYSRLDHPTRMEILDAAYRAIRGLAPQQYRPTVDDTPLNDSYVGESSYSLIAFIQGESK